jgi:hypothetical protein
VEAVVMEPQMPPMAPMVMELLVVGLRVEQVVQTLVIMDQRVPNILLALAVQVVEQVVTVMTQLLVEKVQITKDLQEV